MTKHTSAKLVVGRRRQPGPDQCPTLTLDASQLQQHTLVLGQSGSGKSFFLTRLVEEIVLRTKARVLVLDPNGDYQRLPDINANVFASQQKEFQYANKDSEVHLGIHPLDNDSAFSSEWEERRFRILSFHKAGDGLPISTKTAAFAHIWLSWSEITDTHDFLLDFASPSSPLNNRMRNGLSACYRHAKQTAYPNDSDGRFGLNELIESLRQFKDGNVKLDEYPEARDIDRDEWRDLMAIVSRLLHGFSSWYDHSLKDSPEIRRHLEVPFRKPPSDAWDALVLCLNRSSSPFDSLLVAETSLRSLWELSKERWEESISGYSQTSLAPTFVVVDEAHNFAPKEATSELQARVRERLMQIAAEGRKYGIYLILGTQRPRKLHDGLTLECENYALMRVQSQEELRFAEENFGLKNSPMVQSVPNFKVGTALMSGRWVQGIEQIQVVPARTKVGGGNPDDGWMSRSLLGGSLDADALKNALKHHHGIVKMEQAKDQFRDIKVGTRSFSDLSKDEQIRVLERVSAENQDLVFAQFVRARGNAWQIVYMPEYQRQVGSHVGKRTATVAPAEWATVVVKEIVEKNGPVFLSMVGELLIDASSKVLPKVDVNGWFGHGTLRRFLDNVQGLSIGYAQNGAEMVFDPEKDKLIQTPSPQGFWRAEFAEPTMQHIYEKALSSGFELPNVRAGIVAKVIYLLGRFCKQYVGADGSFDVAGVKAAVRLAIEQDAGVITGRDMWYMTTNLMRIGRKLGPGFDSAGSLEHYEDWLVDRLVSICGLDDEEVTVVRRWVRGGVLTAGEAGSEA